MSDAMMAADERRSRWLRVALRALVLAGVFGLCGIVANFVRTKPLAWVAQHPYEIFVPCSDGTGETQAIVATRALLAEPDALWIDARTVAAFTAWHVDGAMPLPYDFLAPVAPAAVQTVVRSGKGRVLVYGDGDNPDCGKELARELAAKARKVAYIDGGAPALRRLLGLGGVDGASSGVAP
jgi:hypothetical protein